MGAFFTNLQVHAGTRSPAEVRAEVIEAVRRHLSGDFAEVAAGEPAARSIVIGPAGAEPWISVYDQATEDQDGVTLAALAAALSSPQRAAVTVLVHDSDVLELGLVQGAPIDLYNSRPDYFTGKQPRGKAREAVCGHPERWRGVLAPGATPAALALAWQGKPVFAEALIDAVAPLLGWNAARARVGFRDLDEAPEDGRTRLGFRPLRTSPHEQRHAGPPRFSLGMFTASLTLAIGDPITLPLGVTSAGGPSRGLAVVAWGPALDQGLIDLDHMQIVRRRLPAVVNRRPGLPGSPNAADPFDRFVAPFAPPASPGAPRAAHFPELHIPAGLVHGMGAPVAGQARVTMEALLATQLSGSLQGRALAVGRAPLNVAYAPLANPDGQFGVAVQLEVTGKLRRPLRAEAAPSAMLRPLEEPTRLFALVVLGPDRERAARVAGEAMERWLEVIAPAPEASFETVLCGAADGVRPKTGKLSAKRLTASKKWHDLRAGLRDCRGFSATLRSPPRRNIEAMLAAPIGRLLMGGHGFSLASTLIGGDASDPDLPHLGLWLDLGAPGVAADTAERTLVGLVDAATASGAVQALLGRWDWSPGFLADSTPYELASGVHGQCTTRQSWCQRFLRGVTGTLWLSAPLLARVDRAALAALAELTPVGDVTRVVLRAPAELGALEAVLAPIIAGAADWQAGMDQMYGRTRKEPR